MRPRGWYELCRMTCLCGNHDPTSPTDVNARTELLTRGLLEGGSSTGLPRTWYSASCDRLSDASGAVLAAQVDIRVMVRPIDVQECLVWRGGPGGGHFRSRARTTSHTMRPSRTIKNTPIPNHPSEPIPFPKPPIMLSSSFACPSLRDTASVSSGCCVRGEEPCLTGDTGRSAGRTHDRKEMTYAVAAWRERCGRRTVIPMSDWLMKARRRLSGETTQFVLTTSKVGGFRI